MAARIILLGLALWLWAAPAYAIFEWHEAARLDDENLYDSRYFLDMAAFALRPRYVTQWQQTHRGGLGQTSSIDENHFQHDVRFRMGWQPEEADWLALRVIYHDVGNPVIETQHTWLELAFLPQGSVSPFIYGDLIYEKEQGIFAGGLDFFNRDDARLRIRYVAVAALYNFHDQQTDEITKNAHSLGTEYFFRSEHWRFDGEAEWDLPMAVTFRDDVLSELEEPQVIELIGQEEREYRYERRSGSANFSYFAEPEGWQRNLGAELGLRLRYEAQRESETFERGLPYVPDPNNGRLENRRVYHSQPFARDDQRYRRQVAEARAYWLTPLNNNVDELLLGVYGILRRAQAVFPGLPVRDLSERRSETIPHIHYWLGFPSASGFGNWSRLELAAYASFAERKESKARQADDPWKNYSKDEYKAIVSWELLVQGEEPGQVQLGTTWSLNPDSLFGWDGGNVNIVWGF